MIGEEPKIGTVPIEYANRLIHSVSSLGLRVMKALLTRLTGDLLLMHSDSIDRVGAPKVENSGLESLDAIQEISREVFKFIHALMRRTSSCLGTPVGVPFASRILSDKSVSSARAMLAYSAIADHNRFIDHDTITSFRRRYKEAKYHEQVLLRRMAVSVLVYNVIGHATKVQSLCSELEIPRERVLQLSALSIGPRVMHSK